MTRKGKAAILYWLLAILFFGGLGGSTIIPQMYFEYALSQSYKTATGEIIETYPNMHSTCEYRFSVGNQTYEHGGGDCGADKIGQKVTIYYSAVDPDKSLNCYPHAAFMNDLIFFMMAVILFPLLAAGRAYTATKEDGQTAK